AQAVALRPQRSAVQLDEALHDRESDAEAAVAPLRRPLPLREELIAVLEHLGRDPLSGVAHGDLDAVAGPLRANRDLSSALGELARVLEQVREDLRQAHLVAI